MAVMQSIRRNLALKELEAKDTPDGKQVAFPMKFVTKNGAIVFICGAIQNFEDFPLEIVIANQTTVY